MDKKIDNLELRNIFLEEAHDLIEALAETLKKWDQDPHNAQYLSAFKRDLHTLKGASCMIGEKQITLLSYEMEMICDAISKNIIPMDAPIIKKFTQGLSYITEIVNFIQNHSEDVKESSDLVLNINHFVQEVKKLFPHDSSAVIKCVKKVHETDLIKTDLIENGSDTKGYKDNKANKDNKNSAGKKFRVMIVDDSSTTRAILQQSLMHDDFHVTMAENGSEALTLLQNIKKDIDLPDIITLDVDMPKMDGLECAKNIRNTERLKHIPIIMHTANATKERLAEAEKLNIEKFLIKPFDEQKLLENIHSLLKE